MPRYDDDDDRPRRRRDDDDDSEDRPRRRRRDDDDDYDDRPRRRSAPPPTNGLAVAALILGLCSFFALCFTGVPAIICGLLAMGKPVGRGMAITGLLLGSLTTLGSIGLGYFGYTATQKAGTRMKDSNNMKQIGLALHNQNDSNGRMYGPYAMNDRGSVNTGLSWRVGLLPYIEQDNLYRRMDMSEAWDSPKNRSITNTPIKTFTSPYDEEQASVKTPYRVFYGGGALFEEDGKPISLWTIADGTSNTIMVVHAMDRVQWAEPRDFKYSDKTPLPKLGHEKVSGGSNVLMCDGSVRFIRDTISERTMRNAITKADGNMMGADW
jgi:prepilin-type processing-associated H-X9-DG protein